MAGGDRYDVVVVGAGAAGCVVASRLASSSPATTVLLVEAGPDLRAAPPPAMHDGRLTYRDFGWGFESEADSRGVVEPLHRGRVVGGTSWVTRFAMRGAPADFDAWVRRGCVGWSFDEVLPAFIRLERDLDFGGAPWHGDAGPIPVTRRFEVEPSAYESAVGLALSSNGFDPVDDHNRPGAIGAGRMPRNAVGDTRVAPADGYLAPEDVPANLTVRAESPVAAVVIDAGRAVAVRLENADVIEAGRVVVSAGVYGSPAILMRSGIGPPGHLREVGVPVAVDLPGVGANLADHPGVDIDPGYRSDGDVGPGIFSLATFRSSAAEGDGPDLALWTYDPFGDPPETTIDVVLLTPEARGTVRLRSADPAAPPRIALPEVTSDADIGRLAEGVRRAWDVANDRALRGVCAVPPAPSPGSDADLRASIRRSAYSYPHVVGTCAMGSPESGAVVDPSGAVYGVDGLSVVDASVIPASGVGFPHLVTVMLAERLSERLVAEA